MGSRPVGHGHAGGMLGPVRDEEDEPRVSRRPRRNMRRLLPYFRPYRRRVIWTIILMLVVTAAGLAGPALAQVAIDDGRPRHGPQAGPRLRPALHRPDTRAPCGRQSMPPGPGPPCQ